MTTWITVVYILCGMYIVQIMWIYFQELKLQLYWTLLERAHSQCHASCDILIKMNTKRCDKCKKYRKVLIAMVSRPQKDDCTNPSSHTTYANLSTPEKNQRLTLYTRRIEKHSDKLDV